MTSEGVGRQKGGFFPRLRQLRKKPNHNQVIEGLIVTNKDKNRERPDCQSKISNKCTMISAYTLQRQGLLVIEKTS